MEDGPRARAPASMWEAQSSFGVLLHFAQPSHCSHLECELADRKSLTQSLCSFQINGINLKDKMNTNHEIKHQYPQKVTLVILLHQIQLYCLI